MFAIFIFTSYCTIFLDYSSLISRFILPLGSTVQNKNINIWIEKSTNPNQIKVNIDLPCAFGNQARVLRKFVREEEVLTQENAIKKMTSLPASFL
jgi:hypothetical protein